MPLSSREKSQETRANIIDSAYKLFIEKGYSATSMRDISRGAGVTVGAIYNHFATKEEIWKQVILDKHPYHEVLPLLEKAEGSSVEEVVRSAARSLVEQIAKRPDLFNLMFIEIVEFRLAHAPDVMRAILPHLQGLSTSFQGKSGQLRPIPPAILLRSFMGFFISYYITGIFADAVPGVGMPKDVLDQFVDLYLHGILLPEDEGSSAPQEGLAAEKPAEGGKP